MKLAEPMITVIIGLVIGLFIIAMVMPMFDAINSIQKYKFERLKI